jgi:hypothetical protein
MNGAKVKNLRRYERVKIGKHADVFAVDEQGKRLGAICVLGQGGLMISTSAPYQIGDRHKITVIDEAEEISRELSLVVRNVEDGKVGFSFETLDRDAAVEIGIIIGKYYESEDLEEE